MKKVTASELEAILIEELAKFEDCAGVKSIGFYRLAEPAMPNWEPSVFNFGDADETLCKSALVEILPRLYEQFELS